MWEREFGELIGELAVDGSEGLELVVNFLSVLRVEEDLQQLALVSADAGALSNNLGGVNEIVENGGVDSSQGAAAGA